MTDTPKFTVVDRRKFRAEEDTTPSTPTTTEAAAPDSPATPEAAPKTTTAPRLTLVEPTKSEPTEVAAPVASTEPTQKLGPVPVESVTEDNESDLDAEDAQLPPAPSPEELQFQKTAYEKAAERLDDLVRAQNPGAPPQEKIGFEHLVQQLYLSAMMQMGAGTPEGQRPRIDILGARQTIDLLNVLQAKSTGNLNAHEIRTLDAVLFELRFTFLELTRMISAQAQGPLPPPPGAKR